MTVSSTDGHGLPCAACCTASSWYNTLALTVPAGDAGDGSGRVAIVASGVPLLSANMTLKGGKPLLKYPYSDPAETRSRNTTKKVF